MATKWIYEVDSSEFNSEEKARDAARENVQFLDIAMRVGYNITVTDIIKELARLDSPLFDTLHEEAVEEYFHDYFYEEACDDEEEDEEC